jgi:hypothetical protein
MQFNNPILNKRNENKKGKSVTSLANMPDSTPLHAKTSHHYLHDFGMPGVLSSPGAGVGVLGAKPEVCLHRCFWQKAVRSSRG